MFRDIDFLKKIPLFKKTGPEKSKIKERQAVKAYADIRPVDASSLNTEQFENVAKTIWGSASKSTNAK